MSMTEQKTLSELRISKGFTQQGMASALGVSEPTYRKYEREPDSMSIKMLKDVCGVLKVESADIFFH